MCTCPTPTRTEGSALLVSGRLLLEQAKLRENPGYGYLYGLIRRAERGVTHPHFGLVRGEREEHPQTVLLSELTQLRAKLLLAWLVWLHLTGDLPKPEDPTEAVVAIIVSANLEHQTLRAATKDVFDIFQFIQECYTFSIYWPFRRDG